MIESSGIRRSECPRRTRKGHRSHTRKRQKKRGLTLGLFDDVSSFEGLSSIASFAFNGISRSRPLLPTNQAGYLPQKLTFRQYELRSPLLRRLHLRASKRELRVFCHV